MKKTFKSSKDFDRWLNARANHLLNVPDLWKAEEKKTGRCPGCDPRWPLNVERKARWNGSLRIWVTCKHTRAELRRKK